MLLILATLKTLNSSADLGRANEVYTCNILNDIIICTDRFCCVIDTVNDEMIYMEEKNRNRRYSRFAVGENYFIAVSTAEKSIFRKEAETYKKIPFQTIKMPSIINCSGDHFCCGDVNGGITVYNSDGELVQVIASAAEKVLLVDIKNTLTQSLRLYDDYVIAKYPKGM